MLSLNVLSAALRAGWLTFRGTRNSDFPLSGFGLPTPPRDFAETILKPFEISNDGIGRFAERVRRFECCLMGDAAVK